MTFLELSDLNSFNQDQETSANEAKLNMLGGYKSLEKTLNTSFVNGLTGDEMVYQDRRKKYGANTFPAPESQSWLEMFVESFADTTLIVLIVAAVVSLAVGLYEDPEKGWIEGGAILFAVVLVALVTATNNFKKEAQFRKLNAMKDDVMVGVIRDSISTTVNVKELVVGDIVRLNAGDKVPADGLLVNGSDVTCNESALTGESEDKRKSLRPAREGGDLFLISGATISAGYCTMLVTAVGENSRWGRTRAKLAQESEDTPLQEKLDLLANQIGQLGMAMAAATFVAMLAIWMLYPASRVEGVSLFEYMLKAFIMAVTIVVVAVPEGLPLAVTLSLAYSTQKMMHDNNLIRVLAACETMGNATNICSDKTGTLTQNRMTVVQAWIAGTSYDHAPSKEELHANVVEFIAVGASVNSTAVLLQSKDNEEPVVNGNATEGALLLYLANKLTANYANIRKTEFKCDRGDRMFTFSSAKKSMSTLCKTGAKTGVLYVKGAAEVIVGTCHHYVDQNGDVVQITSAVRKAIQASIAEMAEQALRVVALAHKKVSGLTGEEEPDSLQTQLVLDGLMGIKDPLRPDVIDAVLTCQQAGIFVRMVTGDNLDTAKAIARECGILTEGGIAMEGPAFRKLTPAQLDAILPKLQVLARSSPDDKYTLVTRLNGHAMPDNREEWEEAHPDENFDEKKELLLPGFYDEWVVSRGPHGGEVVGVTGDGTNDGPALKAADVGLSMGLCGTDVAKEASDIVILDDNFASIVKAVMWGRSVFDNIRKFLQFQLTVNIVALTLTFLSALSGKEPPLNAVMMLWVNLIMDTMGALALGTEPPSETLLHRRPYKRNASLINLTMMRNIAVQFIYQMILLAYLLFLGAKDFDCEEGSRLHTTIIFNTFVFCQVFNEINARSISNQVNVFYGLFSNPVFLQIIAFTVAAQYFLVEYGGDFVKTQGLDQAQWIKCAILGSLSLPLGLLMRFIPVIENDSDFAEISPLIAESLKQRKQEIATKSKSSSGISFSFVVYIAALALSIHFVVQEFGEKWTGHYHMLRAIAEPFINKLTN